MEHEIKGTLTKTIKEEKEKEVFIGDVVGFVDREGKRHNALVICAWWFCLNIAYVDPSNDDSWGNLIIKETSVPFKEEGMSGFYVYKKEVKQNE